MFGIVLPIVNRSACACWASAAASRADRTNPLSRDTMVPAAIRALEARTFSLSVALMAPRRRGRPCGSRGGAHATDEADGDRAEQQRDPGAEDQPDHGADLGGADRDGDGGAERGAVDVGDDQRDVVDAGSAGPRVEQHGGAPWPGCPPWAGRRSSSARPRPLDADGHRLVEPVDQGRGELPLALESVTWRGATIRTEASWV